MSENRSYDFHGTDDLVETEHEQLARITGLPVAVVAAAFAEPVPGQLRPDEIEDARRRVERGEAAEAEMNFRAMVRDIDPSLYTEVPMLDDGHHVMVTPKAKLESQRDGYIAALEAAKAANDRELVAVLERALAEVRRKLASKEYAADDDEERAYRQLAADFPPGAA